MSRPPTQKDLDEVGKLFGNYDGTNVKIGQVITGVQINLPKSVRDDPKEMEKFAELLKTLNLSPPLPPAPDSGTPLADSTATPNEPK